MLNALLYRINCFCAYLTINAPVSVDFACSVLSFQTRLNQYFDYDWGAAVSRDNANRNSN
jgi:hypothetical protein